MTFSTLGLSMPILKAIKEQGYETPSPIQLQAIPVVLEGRDLMAAAQTGTGKTAGFVLPILEILSKKERPHANHTRCLILTPTRELAAQIQESVENYGAHLPLRSTVVFGGVKINPQMMKLRRGVDILVATPGRLLDLFNQNAIKFNELEILVLDEADRMLDMGFIRDIRKILQLLPRKRQNLLFSATFSDEIRELAKTVTHQPAEVSVSPRNTTAETISQSIYLVDKNRKADALVHFIREHRWEQVLIFNKTKHGANKLATYLEKEGIRAAAIHGNKSQGARTKALDDFKNGRVTALVATDIAARGIDIDQLAQVVNFELPSVPEDYVHRIGRTGRAGTSGQAVSFVCADEALLLFDIEALIKTEFEKQTLPDFMPVHSYPRTRSEAKVLQSRAKKAEKQKTLEYQQGQRNSRNAASANGANRKTGSTANPLRRKRTPTGAQNTTQTGTRATTRNKTHNR